MLRRLACLSLIGLSALGCSKETTSSKNIKTGGIAALIDVYADNDTTARVHVELRIAGSSSNAYVILEGQDKLIASAGDESKTLEGVSSGVYEGTFSGVGEDTEFTVTLDRPEQMNAMNTGMGEDLLACFDALARDHEARAAGLVNHLVPAGQAKAKATEIASTIARNGPIAVRQAKKAIAYGSETDLETAMILAIEAYNATVVTEDRLEGVRAFNEKRKPQFKGR